MLRSIFRFKEYNFWHLNVKLVLYTIVLSVIGIFVIRSATMNSGTSAYLKQIMGLCIGVAIMAVVALIDYHFWVKLRWVIYACAIGLLVATQLFGTYSNTGAKRWITFPVIGQIQPAEFVKIALILFFAAYFMVREEKLNSPVTVLGSGALALVPLFLIFRQPNLSTTLVTAFVFVVIVFVAKVSYKWILGVLGSLIPIGGIVFLISRITGKDIFMGYMVSRVTVWWQSIVNPQQAVGDLNRQQANSVMAIGSGGLSGKGLFNSSFESVKNGNFLMEEDTDFIFAVVGEELGFIGSCVIIGLLLLIVLECLWMAKRAKDTAGKLICTGMAALLAVQSFVNIGVATHLLPNTGVPLPFISAGLSSLLSVFIGMGLVLNVGLQRRNKNEKEWRLFS